MKTISSEEMTHINGGGYINNSEYALLKKYWAMQAQALSHGNLELSRFWRDVALEYHAEASSN